MSGARAPPPDVKAGISCVDCLNAMFHCFGPFHQFDRYYKDGNLDDCKNQMRELRFCVKLKFADPARTKDMVRELLKQQTGSPTEGVIWEPRRPAGAAAAAAAPPQAAPTLQAAPTQ